MSQGLTWQLTLHVSPQRVFGALVRTTTLQGRLRTIEDFGRAVTFSPSRWDTDLAGRLRARVRPYEGGSLLELTPIDDLWFSERNTVVEAASVGSLIHDLRTHLENEGVLAGSNRRC